MSIRLLCQGERSGQTFVVWGLRCQWNVVESLGSSRSQINAYGELSQELLRGGESAVVLTTEEIADRRKALDGLIFQIHGVERQLTKAAPARFDAYPWDARPTSPSPCRTRAFAMASGWGIFGKARAASCPA